MLGNVLQGTLVKYFSFSCQNRCSIFNYFVIAVTVFTPSLRLFRSVPRSWREIRPGCKPLQTCVMAFASTICRSQSWKLVSSSTSTFLKHLRRLNVIRHHVIVQSSQIYLISFLGAGRGFKTWNNGNVIECNNLQNRPPPTAEENGRHSQPHPQASTYWRS